MADKSPYQSAAEERHKADKKVQEELAAKVKSDHEKWVKATHTPSPKRSADIPVKEEPKG